MGWPVARPFPAKPHRAIRRTSAPIHRHATIVERDEDRAVRWVLNPVASTKINRAKMGLPVAVSVPHLGQHRGNARMLENCCKPLSERLGKRPMFLRFNLKLAKLLLKIGGQSMDLIDGAEL